MTDPLTPLAASSLMPDTPLPAAEMPMGTPDLPAISRVRSDAMAEVNRLKGDAGFQQLLLKGDPHALARVQQLSRIVSAPTQTIVGNENPQEAEARLSTWTNFADLSPEVIQQVRTGGAVSKQEYDSAKQMKGRLMSDKAWAARYLDGGRTERQQMSLISIILASPIAAEQK
jgi:hypothetical protein